MKYKIKYLKRGDVDFPKKLEQLDNCPDVLYVLGNEKILNEFSLGIVGSRKCSEFGREISKNIAKDLSDNNVVVVSGLALGIDSAAHMGCVKNNGKTIAVLGSGFDNIYPRINMSLIDEIIDNGGAIITEYLPDTLPLKLNFKERNRIIAALSEGVILIEAKERSGSLITIRFAKELNKKVFVLPGAVNDELYEGGNKLLVDGAFCIQSAEDVLSKFSEFKDKLDCKKKKDETTIDVPIELKEIYSKIKYKPISLEKLSVELNENTSTLLVKLTLLEMNGLIKQMPGKKFMRCIR